MRNKIWKVNFVSSLSLMALFFYSFYKPVNLKESDKNVVVVYFLVGIAFTTLVLVYQFYTRIYIKKVGSIMGYLMTAALPFLLSVLVLYLLATELAPGFSIDLILFSLAADAVAITYIMGCWMTFVTRR